jgi:sugar O-acyltransferase (sialic acid O-acetyltransferase NeuD family)
MSLYILGVGGLAKEVYGWLVAEKSPMLEDLCGFLVTDSSYCSMESFNGVPVKVLDTIDQDNGFEFLACIGDSVSRKKAIEQVLMYGGTPKSFVSINALIGQNVIIGEGSIVNPCSTISSDVTIGKYTIVNCNNGIGHDCVVGDYVTVLGNAAINGHILIGDFVTIGSGAILHPKVKVGDFASVGIGSIVIRNVKSNTTVFGNPAKKI